MIDTTVQQSTDEAAQGSATENGITSSIPVVSLSIGGMSCASCVAHVEEALLATPGVRSARVNLATETAEIEYDGDSQTELNAHRAVTEAGYEVRTDASHEAREQEWEREEQSLWKRFVVSAPLAALVMVVSMAWMYPYFEGLCPTEIINYGLLALTLPVMLYSGKPIYVSAWRAALNGSTTMDTLVAIGTGAAFAFSVALTLAPDTMCSLTGCSGAYYDSVTTIIALILLGNVLEARAKRAARRELSALAGLRPSTARVRSASGSEADVPVAMVRPGNTVIVRPGERIAVDGIVAEGTSYIDEAMLTGEPVPVHKYPGRNVFAGTINANGVLAVRTTASGAATMLAGIVRMVEQAQAGKAPIQRLADSISAVFVPIVIGLSFVTFAAWWIFGPEGDAPAKAIINAVSVLVIACPCALGLATPISILVGTGRAARLGILYRNAEVVQTMGGIHHVVFDKTGTLTTGNPSVQKVTAATGTEYLLPLIAAVERHSEHPLARTIALHLGSGTDVRVEDIQAVPGCGITAEADGHAVAVGKPEWIHSLGVDCSEFFNISTGGHTAVIAAVDGRAVAHFSIADDVRAEARTTVEALKRRGIGVSLLTGDSEAAARAVANAVGIDHVTANVLPAQKAEAVHALRQKGLRVAMIGDGINDAPALAVADIGVAMGSGTDVAIETADITLVRSSLELIPLSLDLSKATMRTIRQNLFFAFVYNAVGIPVAAGVLWPAFDIMLDPMLAAAAMAMSSVSVILNALRLRRFAAKENPVE